MQKFGRKTLIAMLTITLIILSSTSCSQMFGQNNKQQSKNEQQQKKDPPFALTEMEKETDNMIQQIQKVRDQRAQMIRQQMDDSQKDNNGKQSNQGQQKSSKGGQKQGQQQQQQDKQQSQNQGVQQAQFSIKWQDFEKSIKTLNELWNNYEPQAKKDGASDVLIYKFETQLNTLTNTVMAHNEDGTLLAANDLYQYYSQFLNLYRHKAPPEIKEVKYYMQQILIYAEAGKWENAATLLENMEKAWQTAKSRMQKPDEKLNERINYAMEDFLQAVKQKDLELVKLKGEILLKNLEKIK